jgi:hypothetical protein
MLAYYRYSECRDVFCHPCRELYKIKIKMGNHDFCMATSVRIHTDVLNVSDCISPKLKMSE